MFIACGRHPGLRDDPRPRHRHWLNQTTFFTCPPPCPHRPRLAANLQVTGQGEVRPELPNLQAMGVQLLGRLTAWKATPRFADDLADSVAFGSHPPSTAGRRARAARRPFRATAPPSLDLRDFASHLHHGYRPNYAHWVNLPAFDTLGYPITNDGASTVVPGLFFCGVPSCVNGNRPPYSVWARTPRSSHNRSPHPISAGRGRLEQRGGRDGYRRLSLRDRGRRVGGCVLANRLSATRLPGCTARSGRTHRSGNSAYLWRPSNCSKAPMTGTTAPQAAALSERELSGREARPLGGSSSINGMAWVRGHRADYDGWAQRCTGWSYDEVLPYFHRAEHRVGRRRRGVRNLRRAVHLALRPFVGRPMAPWPGQVDDANLAQYVRENAQTAYHPVGACRMGTDDGAVVDCELRVRGLDGLRVVDASVMPQIIRGHPHAPTVMIAERAVDLIRASKDEPVGPTDIA